VVRFPLPTTFLCFQNWAWTTDTKKNDKVINNDLINDFMI